MAVLPRQTRQHRRRKWWQHRLKWQCRPRKREQCSISRGRPGPRAPRASCPSLARRAHRVPPGNTARDCTRTRAHTSVDHDHARRHTQQQQRTRRRRGEEGRRGRA
eukprot:2591677-Rhodomonas_salina.1